VGTERGKREGAVLTKTRRRSREENWTDEREQDKT